MNKNVLFAASECFPFVKNGGLADFCGALPEALNSEEWDVRVVIPCYTCIPERFRNNFTPVTSFYMSAGPAMKDKYVGVFEYVLGKVTYYFIDNKEYFDCEFPYGEIRKDIERFIFFDKAVLSMLPLISFRPDIIHCNDWETGLIPVYLSSEFQGSEFFRGIRTLMTVHNLKYQGIWDMRTIRDLSGLAADLFTSDKLEFRGDANILKGGLVYADYISTVSETYCSEIQTYTYGAGLNGILAARHMQMQGIPNGIDPDQYDPMTDEALPWHYDKASRSRQKEKNKEYLQKELGLPVRGSVYMIGFASRLTDQKGMDLILSVLEGIIDDYTQLVIIGTGNTVYENMLRDYAWRYSDRLSVSICEDEQLGHRLFGACDSLLIPSDYEACGQQQMIAFRYGVVPIVRAIGGLKDTVIPLRDGNADSDGFAFYEHSSVDFLREINYSKQVYYDSRDAWDAMACRGMERDFSWKASAMKYQKLYSELIGKTN